MARSQIPFQVRDNAGNVRSGVACTVTVRAGGANALVWSAETGGSSVSGTATTDANGFPAGWLDEGSYNILVTGTPNYTRAFEILRGDGAGKIGPNVITSNKLAEATVQSAKFANLAVATAKYQDASLLNAAFADDSIDTRVLANDAVTEPKIQSGALSPRVVAAGALTAAKFGTQSVGTVALQDNSVTNAKMATDAVTSVKLANASVTNAKVGVGTVQGPKFGDGVIDLVHIDPDFMPIGFIIIWPKSSAPSSKWLLCQGQTISRSTYSQLFANVGTAYGAGDGSTTFRIPDLRGRGVWAVNPSAAQINARGLDDGYGAEVNVQYRGPRHHHSLGSMGYTTTGDHEHYYGRPVWSGVVRSGVNSSDARFNGTGWSGSTGPNTHGHGVYGYVGQYQQNGVHDTPPWLTINYAIRVL